MDNASSPPPADRPLLPDNTRWTGAKAATFLKLLARSGKVAASARAVGMSRQAAYRLRGRAPQFAALWERAMAEAEAQQASARRERKAVHPLLARTLLPPQSDAPARPR